MEKGWWGGGQDVGGEVSEGFLSRGLRREHDPGLPRTLRESPLSGELHPPWRILFAPWWIGLLLTYDARWYRNHLFLFMSTI